MISLSSPQNFEDFFILQTSVLCFDFRLFLFYYGRKMVGVSVLLTNNQLAVNRLLPLHSLILNQAILLRYLFSEFEILATILKYH